MNARKINHISFYGVRPGQVGHRFGGRFYHYGFVPYVFGPFEGTSYWKKSVLGHKLWRQGLEKIEH